MTVDERRAEERRGEERVERKENERKGEEWKGEKKREEERRGENDRCCQKTIPRSWNAGEVRRRAENLKPGRAFHEVGTRERTKTQRRGMPLEAGNG